MALTWCFPARCCAAGENNMTAAVVGRWGLSQKLLVPKVDTGPS